MKHQYRITPEGRGKEPDDDELRRYRNSGKLLYNYQHARSALHRKPLYKDPKSFVVLLIIVLLAWFISEHAKEPPVKAKAVPESRP